jgi:uncharacterized coiled-coil DUF342 family protein
MELKKSQTDYLVVQHAKESLEQRILAIQSIDHFNVDMKSSEIEWKSKLEMIKKTTNTKADLVPFLDKIYYRLIETMNEYQNYRDRAFEMKSERNKFKKLVHETQETLAEAITKRDATIQQLQYKIDQLVDELRVTQVSRTDFSFDVKENSKQRFGVAPGAHVLIDNVDES